MNKMTNRVNPNMVIIARESRGLTQNQLAKKAKVSRSLISLIEIGEREVTEDILAKLSEALYYPEGFFSRKGVRHSPLHRKRQASTKKEGMMMDAFADMIASHLATLLEEIEYKEVDIRKYKLEEYDGQPEKAAIDLRRRWNLPKGPVENLTHRVERAGIIVIHIDIETEKIDGFTITPFDTPPIIFLNRNRPGDRIRFTLVHELGHIVLHKFYNMREDEKEVDRFASEFLMPSDEIKHDLRRLDLPQLAVLKKHWQVSMQAIIEKAYNLKLMTKDQRQKLYIKMSQLGYRKNEPVEIPVEPPGSIKKILTIQQVNFRNSAEKIRSMLELHADEFQKYYGDSISNILSIR